MTKTEMEDKYFSEFLLWCATPPKGADSKLVFWLDTHNPTTENFWEWMVHCKPDVLR